MRNVGRHARGARKSRDVGTDVELLEFTGVHVPVLGRVTALALRVNLFMRGGRDGGRECGGGWRDHGGWSGGEWERGL